MISSPDYATDRIKHESQLMTHNDGSKYRAVMTTTLRHVQRERISNLGPETDSPVFSDILRRCINRWVYRVSSEVRVDNYDWWIRRGAAQTSLAYLRRYSCRLLAGGRHRIHDDSLANLQQVEAWLTYFMNATRKRERCANLFSFNHPQTNLSLHFLSSSKHVVAHTANSSFSSIELIN